MAPTATFPLNDPQQLARMRALAMLFPGQQQAPQVSDENATAAPQPAPTISGAKPAAADSPAAQQPQTLAQPGAISKGVGSSSTAAPASTIPTFADYAAKNAPAPEPMPSFKQRALHALYAGGIGALGGEDAGVNYYTNWLKPNESKLAQQQAIDEKLHTGYQNTVADAEAPTKFDQLKAQVEDAEAQAKQRQADATKAQADADKAEAAAKNPPVKLQRSVIADAEGNPKSADFNPQTGEYIDPDTHQPIPNAKQWEKPQAIGTLDDQISRAAADALKTNVDPNKDAKLQQLVALYRSLHPSDPGTPIPIYDQKSGALQGFYNPKTEGWTPPPKQSPAGTTGQGLTEHDKMNAAQEKQAAPLQQVIDETGLADQLKSEADGGNAEADVSLVLQFFKAMRGATQGSNIRFTQQENSLITGARSFMGDVEVKANKVTSNGEPLSGEQRNEMLQVIHAYRDAAQRRLDDLKKGFAAAAPPASASAAPQGGSAPNPNDPAGLY